MANIACKNTDVMDSWMDKLQITFPAAFEIGLSQ